MSLIDRSPETIPWAAFVIGVLAAISLFVSTSTAVKYQQSGEAIYRSGPKGMNQERVSRASNPQKFEEATNRLWFQAICSLGASSIGIYFFRRLSA